MALRLAFMGTSAFAVPSLSALITAGHAIAAVYTRAPRPAGRGQKEQPSPVQRLAEAHGLLLRTPARLAGEAEEAAFAALDLDAAVVAAYGHILPRAFLSAPRQGCLNVHASLLPRWRGAAPIARAIMAGDRETGVSIIKMDEGLDTGPILLSEAVPIAPEMTGGALQEALAALGARLIVQALDLLARGQARFTPQQESSATYAPKLTKDEMRLDWSKDADTLARQVRALAPQPGAWCMLGETRLKVLEAEAVEGTAPPGTLIGEGLTVACGRRALRLKRVQRAGKAPMSAEAFLRGARLSEQTRFT